MKYRRTAICIGTSLLLLTLAGVASAQDAPAPQDSLGTVKSLYASAAYEDALTAIERLRTTNASPGGLDQYRAFCLLALGRESEATKAMEDVITADPFFAPDQSDVSPRVLTLFHGVRRRMLPPIVQQKYAMAKATYDRKEYAAAAEQFTRVMTLLDDADLDAKAAGLTDLKTLTSGFLDLSKAAAEPPKPAQPVQPPPPPVPAGPPPKAVYDASDSHVLAPTVVRQDFPPYPVPQGPLASAPMRPGVIEIVIDETGRVIRMTMRQSMNSAYDAMLLTASANWRYRPATLNGTPVKYRKLIQVNIEPRK